MDSIVSRQGSLSGSKAVVGVKDNKTLQVGSSRSTGLVSEDKILEMRCLVSEESNIVGDEVIQSKTVTSRLHGGRVGMGIMRPG